MFQRKWNFLKFLLSMCCGSEHIDNFHGDSICQFYSESLVLDLFIIWYIYYIIIFCLPKLVFVKGWHFLGLGFVVSNSFCELCLLWWAPVDFVHSGRIWEPYGFGLAHGFTWLSLYGRSNALVSLRMLAIVPIIRSCIDQICLLINWIFWSSID